MYLQRINFRPNADELSERQRSYLHKHFDFSSTDVIVHGDPIAWDSIEEVQVVPAARLSGLSGWLTRRIMGCDRYHVGIYFGKREVVLPNISLAAAKYILQTIAYHAPYPVRYKGMDDLVPLAAEA